MQVQEDRTEDLLPQGCNLLKHIELKSGGPCTATRPESQVVNMFGCREIVEYIYEDVLEPSYKKLLGKNTPIMDTSGKWVEDPPFQKEIHK